jgi:hypothetical protein
MSNGLRPDIYAGHNPKDLYVDAFNFRMEILLNLIQIGNIDEVEQRMERLKVLTKLIFK